jgi:hypothetical protein
MAINIFEEYSIKNSKNRVINFQILTDLQNITIHKMKTKFCQLNYDHQIKVIVEILM